jgi:CDP-2,3-bis-(O-geranylgeranyl)-sn-glycerol synthase
MQYLVVFQLVFLLLVANGTPVLVKRVLGQRFSFPLDGGVKIYDGQRLFGPSKTVRGVLLSILVTSASAPLIGLDLAIGAIVGTASMAGDIFSSFLKRRLRLPPSSKVTGLDQIPESLFPLLSCRWMLTLTIADVVAGVAIFFVGEIILSQLLYRVGIRRHPY